MDNDKNTAFLSQQLDQSIQTYRSALTVLVQIMTVLIVANSAVFLHSFGFKRLLFQRF